MKMSRVYQALAVISMVIISSVVWEANFPKKEECTPEGLTNYRFQLCVGRYYSHGLYPTLKDYLLSQGFIETTRPEDVENNRFSFTWQSKTDANKTIQIVGQYRYPEGELSNFSVW